MLDVILHIAHFFELKFVYLGGDSMEEVAERIFDKLAERRMEQKELAKAIGVRPTTVSEWRIGKTASYRKYLPEIAEALGTTVGYLLTGETAASMISPNDNDLIPWPATDDDFVSRFEQLNPYSRALILTLMRSLLNEDNRAVMDSAVNGLLHNQATK